MRRIITLDNGTRWRCEGVSRRAMLDEIAHARMTGSVGSRSYESYAIGNGNHVWIEKLIADVHLINSDYSDRKPS